MSSDSVALAISDTRSAWLHPVWTRDVDALTILSHPSGPARFLTRSSLPCSYGPATAYVGIRRTVARTGIMRR